MQVKNIECQIAQAQLRRYLTGEEMPSAIVNDLETHLKHCPDCMAAAQSLRESLRGALTSKVTGRPEPVQAQPQRQAQPEPKRQEQPIAQAVASGHAAVHTPADVLSAPDSDFKPEKPKRKATNTKTLFYSGALALVLILMSTVFKDPTALFGPRAYDSHKDTPPATTNEPTSSEPTGTDQTSQPTTEPAATTTQPTNTTANAGAPASGTNTAATGAQGTPNGPISTDGLIVADSVTGTTLVKTDPKKQQPKPGPTQSPNKRTARPTNKKPTTRSSKGGVGSIRVYPPDK